MSVGRISNVINHGIVKRILFTEVNLVVSVESFRAYTQNKVSSIQTKFL